MKFLVISDSHGNFERFNNVLGMHNEIETIFFLGDGMREFDDVSCIYPNKTFYCVSGNCDLMSLKPSSNILNTSQGKILYTHGDAYGVKNGLGKLTLEAKNKGVLLALFGHTHTPHFENRGGVYLFNPGSLGANGNYGIIEIKENKVIAEHKTL